MLLCYPKLLGRVDILMFPIRKTLGSVATVNEL